MVIIIVRSHDVTLTLCIPFSENVWMKRMRRVLSLTAPSSITSSSSSSWWYSKPSWQLLSAMILTQLYLHSDVVSALLQACSIVCQPPQTKNKGQQVQSNNREASQWNKAANQTGLLEYLQVVLSYPAALVAWAVTVQLDIRSCQATGCPYHCSLYHHTLHHHHPIHRCKKIRRLAHCTSGCLTFGPGYLSRTL